MIENELFVPKKTIWNKNSILFFNVSPLCTISSAAASGGQAS
jgi:hypothetical protein